MKRTRNEPPEVVFRGCSTTKAAYEQAYTPAQLSELAEYRKIIVQMENIVLRFPNLKELSNA